MNNLTVKEITKENEDRYVDQIAELEESILSTMKKQGKGDLFFPTGKEDISEYVNSDDATVMCAIEEKDKKGRDIDKVISAVYITQGQKLFTYNDLTKYFKSGDNYAKYVKSQYTDENEYKKDMLQMYSLKLKAYEFAKQQIESKKDFSFANIDEYLEHELQDETNKFHEKSKLRQDINTYMTQYMQELNLEDKYSQFYWISKQDIEKEFGREIQLDKQDEIVKSYEKFVEASKLKIHEKPQFDISKYFTANTENAIEIDTYITRMKSRSNGVARMLVYEGVKNRMEKYFEKNPNAKDVFLCSTLHKQNNSSKYVSEFFGLEDSLYVQRRNGIDREVHICQIPRERYKYYLKDMEEKLAVIYGYNPNNIKVSNSREIEIREEQQNYHRKVITGATSPENKTYDLTKGELQRVIRKYKWLKDELEQLKKNKNNEGLSR